jgi:hypothetical protein
VAAWVQCQGICGGQIDIDANFSSNVLAQEIRPVPRLHVRFHNKVIFYGEELLAPRPTPKLESRRIRWAGHVARMRTKRNAYRILVRNQEGKKPLGRPRRRWVDNIKMDRREIGWDGVDWIDLAQDRDQWKAFVNTVMNLWIA